MSLGANDFPEYHIDRSFNDSFPRGCFASSTLALRREYLALTVAPRDFYVVSVTSSSNESQKRYGGGKLYIEIIQTEEVSLPMKQRVVVQAVIRNDDKVLLLHRCQGRPSIVGKYELPGGTLDNEEQPDDALRRHIQSATGLIAQTMQLADVVSMVNREEGDVQHVLVSYTVSGLSGADFIALGRSYDGYEWKQLSDIQRDELRDSAQLLLGMYDTDKVVSEPVSNDGHDGIDNLTNSRSAIIYSDGGSRGNPGQSAAAFVIMDRQQHVLDQGGSYLGITTNNQAEYHGVQLGLERASELGLRVIELRIDSMLVVNQMKGLYKIKNRELWPINERIRTLIGEFEKVTFTHVPRESNQLADLLVNKLLDEHQTDRALV